MDCWQIPATNSIGPRIVVPRDEQTNLITATHAEIHHQGHTKVHHILYPLYYWPGMNADIERVCTSCETCIKATMRGKKLIMVFKPMPGKPFILPRERYGIDFYGLQDGEILVIVDLFSRESFLEYLPNRQQDGVCAALLRRIIYVKGVPKQIRSDINARHCQATLAVSTFWILLRWSQVGIIPEEIQSAST